MKSQNPVTGEPINETTIDCIQDKDFDPAQAMMDDGTCRILDKKESNNTVTWKIECGGGNMPVFHGEGSFVSHGTSAEGEMKMTMTMGASTMEMRNQWQGKKVSSKCDAM